MKLGRNFHATFETTTFDKNQAWESVCCILREQGLAEDTYELINRKLSFDKIAVAIKKYPKPHYGLHSPTLITDFNNVSAGYGLITAEEQIEKHINWATWAKSLSQKPGFIQAFCRDNEYSFWQSMESISYYESQGRSHAHLPKVKRNLPPPLDGLIIDKSNNPGRYVVRSGYVEAVAAEMWFGPAFWERTGANREDVLKCSFVNASEEENDVIHITAGLHTFTSDEGEEAELQNKIRRLLYPNSVDRPIDKL